jgi:hypothetical protein
MNISNKSFYFFILWVFLVSCSPKVYFIDSIRDRLISNGYDITKIQFYTDETIELRRSVQTISKTDVIIGNIQIIDGIRTEIIIIPIGTPGVCEIYADDYSYISVSFEKGYDLIFANTTSGKYAIVNLNGLTAFSLPDTKSTYQLADAYGNPTGRTIIQEYGTMIVEYGSNQYYVIRGKTANLQVRKSEINQSTIDYRTVKGRTVE